MEELITELTPYMTPSPFDEVAPILNNNKTRPPAKPQVQSPPPPRQMSLMTSDPLIRGLAELHPPTFSKIIDLQIHNTYSDTRFKLSFIDSLRSLENKSRLWARDSRFATLDAVETDLGKPSPIKITTFLTLCRLLNVEPFLIIYKHATYVFSSSNLTADPTAPTRALIYSDSNARWTVKPAPAISEHPPYIISNIIKPYKAISSYTAGELKALCAQLGLNHEKTKPALYAGVKHYFSELM